MTCKEWLKAEGRSQTWLAERMQVHKSLVSHWIAGRRLIGVTEARKIEHLSGGKVEARSWFCVNTKEN
jgi:DNA-binding transcriptional regulator YdaS (Cro superfamily)